MAHAVEDPPVQAPDLSRLTIDRDRLPEGPRRALKRNLLLAGAALALIAGAAVVLRAPRALVVPTAIAEVRGGGESGPGGATILTANGYVVARTQASVSSKISGRLEYLGVSEGSVVKKGDVIARLEHADYAAFLAEREAAALAAEASLLEAEADRDQLVRDARRARELAGEDLIAAQEAEAVAARLTSAEARVAAARARVSAAKAAVGVARADLENTTIRAPFGGTVLRKDAEVGEVVSSGGTGGGLTRGAVVTMADLSTLEVEVDVNEAYIAQIRSRQPARIILDAYPTESFRGEVRQVVPTANRQRATVLVKVRILEVDPRILTEMGARVDFLQDEKPAAAAGAVAAPRVVVPAASVVTDAGATYVWIVRDGEAARRAVEVGPVSGGVREVRSGLSGGERVIVGNFESLREGASVTAPETH